MVIVQKRSRRKATGARYKDTLTKRLHEKGSLPAKTVIGPVRMLINRLKGGQQKNRLLSHDVINVYDAAKKKHIKAKITKVAENGANRHFVRRNIMTKGAVIETELGKVKITNRPGQEGTLNGIKVE